MRQTALMVKDAGVKHSIISGQCSLCYRPPTEWVTLRKIHDVLGAKPSHRITKEYTLVYSWAHLNKCDVHLIAVKFFFYM